MPSDGRPPTPKPDLNVAGTAQEAIRVLRENATALSRAALAPFAAVFLVDGVLALVGAGVVVLDLLGFAVVVLATTMFLVVVHRIVLLGPDALARLPRVVPDARDLRYLGRSIVVGLVVALGLALPVIIFAPGLLALPGGIYIFAVVVTLLAMAGLLAVGQKLPATAVDRDVTIGAAWDSTKRAVPALLGLVLVILAPLHLLATTFAALQVAAAVNGFPVIPPLVLSMFAQFAELALLAILLSVVYKRRGQLDLKA